MSNLLSLDLSSALRTAVEQSMPRSRSNALLNSVQAADRAVETGSVTAAASNKDTEAQKDRVEVNGKDVTSLLTGGLFATDAAQANFDLRYTSEANMVGANQQMGRSTFTIIA